MSCLRSKNPPGTAGPELIGTGNGSTLISSNGIPVAAFVRIELELDILSCQRGFLSGHASEAV